MVQRRPHARSSGSGWTRFAGGRELVSRDRLYVITDRGSRAGTGPLGGPPDCCRRCPGSALTPDHRTIPNEIRGLLSACGTSGQRAATGVRKPLRGSTTSAGRPARLVRLHLDGGVDAPPTPGAELELDGRAVGFVGGSALRAHHSGAGQAQRRGRLTHRCRSGGGAVITVAQQAAGLIRSDFHTHTRRLAKRIVRVRSSRAIHALQRCASRQKRDVRVQFTATESPCRGRTEPPSRVRESLCRDGFAPTRAQGAYVAPYEDWCTGMIIQNFSAIVIPRALCSTPAITTGRAAGVSAADLDRARAAAIWESGRTPPTPHRPLCHQAGD